MKKKILIMCTGNSCRSQMAHGFMELLSNQEAEIYSAGLETHGLNPYAVKAMMETEIDISHFTSNNIDEYLEIDFDLVVTVCDHANENCPVFPKQTTKVHKNFSDPAKAQGNEEERMVAFRKVRDEIKEFCEALIGDFVFSN